MMWPHEIPQPTVFALSRRDELVPSRLVAKQLEGVSSSVRVLTHPTLKHGQFLLDHEWQDQFIAAFVDAVATCTSSC